MTGCTNHEEILAASLKLPFDYEKGPLWRMVLVDKDDASVRADRGDANLKHTLVFAFSCHHSIADGIYLIQIFRDFIELLYLVYNGDFDILSSMNKSEIHPHIENMLPVTFTTDRIDNRGRKQNLTSLQEKEANIRTTSSIDSVKALDAYEDGFLSEINRLSNNIECTGTVRFRFSEGHSRGFLLASKAHHVTVTSSCIAAACMSLTRLLEASIPSEVSHLVIPVLVMVDLRRYVTHETKIYTGCAAIHVPLNVSIPLRCARNRSSKALWEISQQCTQKISNIISSGKPIEVMKEMAEREINGDVPTGKLPYVICFSNLYKLGDMVKPEVNKNFILTSFPGLTRIAVDDMPIFYITVFTLNSELDVHILYCEGYTSPRTAAKYAWFIKDSIFSICRHSSL